MSQDENVVGEICGCDDFYAAKILEDTKDAFRAGVPFYLAALGEAKYDPKVSSDDSYYDNKKMFTYYSGAPEVTLTVSGVSERRKAELSGQPFDPATGRAYDTGEYDQTPHYAVGFRVSLGNGNYLYRWFYKGTFSLGAIDAKTKEDKTNASGYELTYSPLSTVHQWSTVDPKNSANTIKTSMLGTSADTTEAAFTGAEDWFNQVQTPEASAIEALTVTALPADKATDVAADVKPTLTFNNAIASDAVTLLAADGTLVNTSKSYDATGKVLTIAPAAALTSGAAYSIVVVGVADVYGQSLDATVIKFTVA